MEETANNRRQSDRFDFEDTFVLEAERFQGFCDTRSKNVSKTGALLFSSSPVPEGSIVSVGIPSQRIQLLAEVRWVNPLIQDEYYEIGIHFEDLFSSTSTKVSNLIERIRKQVKTKIPKAFVFSFELETNIASFLNQHAISNLRSNTNDAYSSSYYYPRHQHTPMQYSFFTPAVTNPKKEITSVDFRTDAGRIVRTLPARPILLTLLALSLFFYRETFRVRIPELISPSIPMPAVLIPEKTGASLIPNSTNNNEVTFDSGLIEKIRWSGFNEQIQINIQFFKEIQPSQIKTAKITLDDHPRQLIKIMDVDEDIETKDIPVNHPLVNQIRMGLHDEDGQKNLHIVFDMTSADIEMNPVQQNGKELKFELARVQQ